MARFMLVEDYEGELPKRGTKTSAGYDLTARDNIILPANSRVLVKTGVTIDMADDEYLAIVPRSGLALKNGITVLNAPGTIDSDYFPNEIGVILYNSSAMHFEINKGDRIAQAILCKYNTVENDIVVNKERQGGFGSTGVSSEVTSEG